MEIITFCRGSRRVRYRHLPRSAWPELNRLKREESFSDAPFEPLPGCPALFRSLWDERDGRVILDIVIVDGDGKVHRFSESIVPLKPLPRVPKRPGAAE